MIYIGMSPRVINFDWISGVTGDGRQSQTYSIIVYCDSQLFMYGILVKPGVVFASPVIHVPNARSALIFD